MQTEVRLSSRSLQKSKFIKVNLSDTPDKYICIYSAYKISRLFFSSQKVQANLHSMLLIYIQLRFYPQEKHLLQRGFSFVNFSFSWRVLVLMEYCIVVSLGIIISISAWNKTI